MDEQQFSLSREEILFQKMKEFHLQRVGAVEVGDVPLHQRDGGILVLHLVPESCVFNRKLLDERILKEQGIRIRPLGDSGGNNRFNVDGFLNFSGHQDVRAYSQLFRDGRLESVMSDVGYPVNSHAEKSPYAIRCSLMERSVFEVVHDYLSFCKATEFEPPVWLFSSLVGCKDFRVITDWGFRDLSTNAVDRTPAIFPELKIMSFDTEIKELLRPWCNWLWQASGIERSFSYDEEGNWHERR